MDNLKLPAYPNIDSYENGNICTPQSGFTKLELASLMIAQGLMSSTQFSDNKDNYIATQSVKLAKAVLEEANK